MAICHVRGKSYKKAKRRISDVEGKKPDSKERCEKDKKEINCSV